MDPLGPRRRLVLTVCRISVCRTTAYPTLKSANISAQLGPSLASDRDRTDLVLDPVVVDRQLAIVDEAHQRLPGFEAVVDRLQAVLARVRLGQVLITDSPQGR
jgi:hypothetical protein